MLSWHRAGSFDITEARSMLEDQLRVLTERNPVLQER